MKKQTIKVRKIAQYKHISDTTDLLNIVDHLRVQTRKAESLTIWHNKFIVPLEQGRHDPLSILKAAQVKRDVGVMDNDKALSCIYLMAEWLAEDVAPNDPKLKEISARICSIEKRNGLVGGEFWLNGDPDAPEKWREWTKKWNHRHKEIIAAIMKQWGEYEIADLFLNNKKEFHRRFENGRRHVFKNRLNQPG